MDRPPENCPDPVSTENDCKNAGNFLSATITVCEEVVNCIGLKGCVSDKRSGNHIVYWNSEGFPSSSDPKTRTICRGNDETPDKRKLDCKNRSINYFSRIRYI